MSKTYTPPTFSQDDIQGWKSYLDKKGYVVPRDILTFENKENILKHSKGNGVKLRMDSRGMTHLHGFLKNLPLMLSKGMLSSIVVGGISDFMWSLRTDPNIYGIFEKLFDSTDVVCSFDGFSAFFDL